MIPETVLVDARSLERWLPTLLGEMTAARVVGIDCETHDDNRHEGLNRYCGYDPLTRKKAPKARTVFDMRRIVMCGFSLYAQGSRRAWYVNLNHADVENRVPWEKARQLLDAIDPGAHLLAHNAPFELTVFRSCYGYELTQVVCTLQMCVSAYGPDGTASGRGKPGRCPRPGWHGGRFGRQSCHQLLRMGDVNGQETQAWQGQSPQETGCRRWPTCAPARP